MTKSHFINIGGILYTEQQHLYDSPMRLSSYIRSHIYRAMVNMRNEDTHAAEGWGGVWRERGWIYGFGLQTHCLSECT